MKTVNPSLEDFQKHVENHVLTIRHDDGLYRHLTMAKPNTICMSYSITTWPGFLCISGDVGCFVFSRLSDMFDFHRGGFDISFGYWAEKVKAGTTTEFSREALKQTMKELYEQFEKRALDGWMGLDFYLEQADNTTSMIDAGEVLTEFFRDCGKADYEFWEYQFKEYTFDFIWCCYAIAHAIQQYDKVKDPNNTETVEV